MASYHRTWAISQPIFTKTTTTSARCEVVGCGTGAILCPTTLQPCSACLALRRGRGGSLHGRRSGVACGPAKGLSADPLLVPRCSLGDEGPGFFEHRIVGCGCAQVIMRKGIQCALRQVLDARASLVNGATAEAGYKPAPRKGGSGYSVELFRLSRSCRSSWPASSIAQARRGCRPGRRAGEVWGVCRTTGDRWP